MSDSNMQWPSLRRQYDRSAAHVCALVHARRRFQTVVIADFSRGGVQLQGCFGLAAGDAIVLELLSGHQLSAKVVWSLGSRLGAQFPDTLQLGDPGLSALQQAAARRAMIRTPLPETVQAAGAEMPAE